MTQETDNKVDLSIIYVNWNSTSILCESIGSIIRNPLDLHYEIIVVDNASPDGDVEVIRTLFPAVKIIDSPVNVGFGAANNLGARIATGAALLFINPDTLLKDNTITTLYDHLYELPAAGVLGCRLLNGDGSIQTSAIQTFPTIINQLLDIEALRMKWPSCSLWKIDPLLQQSEGVFAVEVISGACMMVKRMVFENIGMFTEDYFMYAEDLDLCRKAILAGHTNWYVARACLIHYGGQSSNGDRATRAKWDAILKYVKRYNGSIYVFAFRVVLICAALFRLSVLLILELAGLFSSRFTGQRLTINKWRVILATMVRPRIAN